MEIYALDFFENADYEVKWYSLLLTILCFLLLATICTLVEFLNRKCTFRIRNNLKINIFYGDLFEQKGNIIIPVNEYFDTIVDDKIIAEKTLHGQFVKKIFQREN